MMTVLKRETIHSIVLGLLAIHCSDLKEEFCVPGTLLCPCDNQSACEEGAVCEENICVEEGSFENRDDEADSASEESDEDSDGDSERRSDQDNSVESDADSDLDSDADSAGESDNDIDSSDDSDGDEDLDIDTQLDQESDSKVDEDSDLGSDTTVHIESDSLVDDDTNPDRATDTDKTDDTSEDTDLQTDTGSDANESDTAQNTEHETDTDVTSDTAMGTELDEPYCLIADGTAVNDCEECLPDGVDASDLNALRILFPDASAVSVATQDSETYYVARRNDKIIGYAFSGSSYGYEGPVECLTAVDVLNTSVWVVPTDYHSSEWMYHLSSNFYGLFACIDLNSIDIPNRQWGDHEVDVVSGATYSAAAVIGSVWEAFEKYQEIIGLD